MWNCGGASQKGVNFCIGAGSPCQGCTQPNFPDGMSPFFRLSGSQTGGGGDGGEHDGGGEHEGGGDGGHEHTRRERRWSDDRTADPSKVTGRRGSKRISNEEMRIRREERRKLIAERKAERQALKEAAERSR